MKQILFLSLFLLITFTSNAQDTKFPSGELRSAKIDSELSITNTPQPLSIAKPKSNKAWNTWGRTATVFGCGIVAGSARATREVLIIDYSKFEAKFPGANEQFWNPEISWQNKWKNGDYTQGPRFPLSHKSFVPLTDAYHGLPAVERMFLMGGCITAVIGEKRKWWMYAIDIAALNIGFWTAANVGYDNFYKMNNQ